MKNERGQRHNYVERGVTVGFLTDPTLCIGCKACEVACKEWNDVPSDGGARAAIGSRSYDHSGDLGASTWRHVKFVETETEEGLPRWLFLSDVCKHCERAGCLEACPTGAIWRTEVGSVLVDDDRCNGCGYCVVSCPFGVIDRRGRPTAEIIGSIAGTAPSSGSSEAVAGEGGAFKCTLCYDRQVEGKIPACANACPTDSIMFGPLVDLKEYAQVRVETLHQRGVTDAVLYDGQEGNVNGIHAMSVLVGGSVGDAAGDAADLWGQPSNPTAPYAYLAASWSSALLTVVLSAVACWLAFVL